MTQTDDTNARQYESFKTALSSTLKALSTQKNIDVNFAASESALIKSLSSETENISLPIPDRSLSPRNKSLMRAHSDAKALYLKHHNAQAHRANAPMDLTAKSVADAMEQARCEALGMNKMRGVKKNLTIALDERFKKLGYSTIENRESSNIADAMYFMTRQALSDEDIPESAQNLYDLWKPWLKEKLGETDLKSLGKDIDNQAAFAQKISELLARIDLQGAPADEPDEDIDLPDQQSDNLDEEDDGELEQEDIDHPENKEESLEESDETQDSADDNAEESQATDYEPAEEEASEEFYDEDGESVRREIGDVTKHVEPEYNIFTTSFDEVIKAEELADPMELARLRKLLDKQIAHIQSLVTKLANKLQRQLMAQQRRSWKFDLDEGVLDTARLARMIANPSIPLVYKQEKETEFKDTIVTILIDNSGSMRGRPIAIAAMCSDILARTLERCDVKVEILGFTTRAWKGGKSRELWMQEGSAPHPGRLNDLRHIIYKSADTNWRRSHKNLGLMLKEGLLKENIDGEALAWAYNRLASRPEQRKIMMVISDGAPVDDSTLSVNPSDILEKDLRTIIHWLENRPDIELTAIGIGHDVTRYYQKAITITDASELANALTARLSELFEK